MFDNEHKGHENIPSTLVSPFLSTPSFMLESALVLPAAIFTCARKSLPLRPSDPFLLL